MLRDWCMSGLLQCSPVCFSPERPARLQINAAARALTKSRMKAHITHVLKSLHWPLVNFRIDFKFLLPVYRSLNGFAPKSISNKLARIVSNRSLWSPNTGVPVVSSKTHCSPMAVHHTFLTQQFSLFIWLTYIFVNFILCIYCMRFNFCVISNSIYHILFDLCARPPYFIL